MDADRIIDTLKACQPATSGMLYLPTSQVEPLVVSALAMKHEILRLERMLGEAQAELRKMRG